MQETNYLDTLDHLSETMGDKITLNQALKIADKMEEATERILKREIKGDSFNMGAIWNNIIKEVLENN